MVGRVSDSQPLVGKWETFMEEGGLGVWVVGLDMVGGDRDQVARLVVMV